MAEPVQVADWIADASLRLKNSGSSSAHLDASLLLKETLGWTSAEVISRGRDFLDADTCCKLGQLVKRRLAGEPVHRILGWREFYGRRFDLSPETLIPRPDTETLIDAVLKHTKDFSSPLRTLDIGTGSGIIAITLAAELGAEVTASDISEKALKTAEQNARNLGVLDRVRLVHSDVYESIDGVFDVIVSNPPYIRDADIAGLQTEVQLHDPHTALAGGEDGLNFYRQIFAGAKRFVAEQGILAVECGIGQAGSISLIAATNGFQTVETIKDLAGIDRVFVCKST